MRITKLSLTNFRSFKETQTIEFAPVTLLFGPNSVGKSTILMALFYLQQILEKGQCNPQRLEALGNKFIGGFKNLVNGRDLSKSITIRVDYDKQGAIGSTYGQSIEMLSESSSEHAPKILLQDQASATERVGLEFVISWSKVKKAAYVEHMRVWLNDEFAGRTFCDDGLKNPVIKTLNLTHPLLLPTDHDEWMQTVFDEGAEHLWAGWADAMGYGERGYGWEHDDHFNDDGLISQLDVELGRQLEYGIKAIDGALPNNNMILETAFYHDNNIVTAIINEVLSEVFVSPVDNLLSLLKGSVCIGPLRCIPDATYQPNQYPTQSDWYDGRASWDELSTPDVYRDSKINDWLISEGKLNLGYQLVYVTKESETRFISPTMDIQSVDDALAINDAIGERLGVTISKEDLNLNPSSPQTPITSEYMEELRKSSDVYSKLYVGQEIDKVSSVSLWDVNNQISVTTSDVGVGVSQLLPLIVASQLDKKGIIACEQPELHVHPRVQVAIGDLISQSTDTKQFLIETHSEHLILRLLKRVRQSFDNETPAGYKELRSNDVSILYLEPSETGVQVNSMLIDEEGEFKTRWPEGFFEERREELI
jgi:predicted ATPase